MEGAVYVFQRIRLFHQNVVNGRLKGDPVGWATVSDDGIENISSKDNISHGKKDNLIVRYYDLTKQQLYEFYDNLIINLPSEGKVITITNREIYEAQEREIYALEIELEIRS